MLAGCAGRLPVQTGVVCQGHLIVLVACLSLEELTPAGWKVSGYESVRGSQRVGCHIEALPGRRRAEYVV